MSGEFIQVTKEAFFATVGQLDVHPCIEGDWDNERGYLSVWKTRAGAGEALGRSYGTGEDHSYFVTQDFYRANARAFVGARAGADRER